MTNKVSGRKLFKHEVNEELLERLRAKYQNIEGQMELFEYAEPKPEEEPT